MTSAHPARLPYDDASTPAEMHADCRQATLNLGLDRRFDRRLARAAEAITHPAPSIHFDDYPREVPKREIRVSEAAQRIANALELHLD